MALGRFSHDDQWEVPTVLGASGGYGALFCDEQCVDDWCAEGPSERDPLERSTSPTPLACCAFCWACGSRVNDPEYCVLHSGPCPVESFAETSWALEVCRLLLGKMPSLASVPDTLLDVAEDLWGSEEMDSPERLAAAAAWTWMGYRDHPDGWPEGS